LRPPPRSTLFPYTTLFRSKRAQAARTARLRWPANQWLRQRPSGGAWGGLRRAPRSAAWRRTGREGSRFREPPAPCRAAPPLHDRAWAAALAAHGRPPPVTRSLLRSGLSPPSRSRVAATAAGAPWT